MKFFHYISDGILGVIKFIISLIKHFFIGLFVVITIFPNYIIKGLVLLFNKNKREEAKNKKKSPIPFIMMILSLFIYLCCVFIASRHAVQTLKNKYLTEDIINSTEIIEKKESEEKKNNVINNNSNNEPTIYYPNDYWDYINVPMINVNFGELLNKNPNTVGWIKVNGTNVNYPVVQASDNRYYLEHSYNGNYNSNGWIFADFRISMENFGKNTIIYGHNMTNRTMFGSLTWSLGANWFNNWDNHYVKIATPTSNSVWLVFSVYTIPSETTYLRTIFSGDSFLSWVTEMKNRSIYDFQADVTDDDKILTLSTCDDTGTKRMVMHSKMVNIEYK